MRAWWLALVGACGGKDLEPASLAVVDVRNELYLLRYRGPFNSNL